MGKITIEKLKKIVFCVNFKISFFYRHNFYLKMRTFAALFNKFLTYKYTK